MATLTPFTGVLGEINASHLLRRATLNPNPTLISQFGTYTVQQAMTALCAPLTLQVPEPLDPNTGQAFMQSFLNPTLNGSFGEASPTVGWYLREAIYSNTFQLKAVFWLHSMFILNSGSDGGTVAFFDYMQLLNFYSDKSLKDFAKKVSRCSMMSIYLNNNLNTKNAPNENYAREFLELFTILKGPQDGPGSYTNYTEQDVQMAAKVLTGFRDVPGNLRMNYLDPICHVPLNYKTFSNHDTSNKTFSSKFNNHVITGATTEAGMDTELDAFIDMIFNQQATALNYARRMYRFYVKSTITSEVETGIIAPLANNLMTTNYDISSTLQLLLSSKHFYDAEDSIQYDQIIGGKIKSPLELFLIMYSQFQISIPNPITSPGHNFWLFRNMSGYMYDIGMSIYAPISVVGYIPIYQEPFDNLWVNTAVLRSRYNQPLDLLLEGFNDSNSLTKLDTVLFVKNSGNFSNPANATTLINEMLNLLLAVMPTGSRYTYFTQSLLGGLSVISWQNEWNNYLNNNDDTAVRIALNRLVTAIVKSTEYQVF